MVATDTARLTGHQTAIGTFVDARDAERALDALRHRGFTPGLARRRELPS